MNSYGVHLGRKKSTKEQLYEKLLEKWITYSLEHQTILKKYWDLIKYRKEHNIKPNGPLRKDTLDSFPEIPFLDFKTKELAEAYLQTLSEVDLKLLLSEVDNYADSMVRRELKARIQDYEYDLRHRGEEKFQFGMLAEKC